MNLSWILLRPQFFPPFFTLPICCNSFRPGIFLPLLPPWSASVHERPFSLLPAFSLPREETFSHPDLWVPPHSTDRWTPVGFSAARIALILRCRLGELNISRLSFPFVFLLSALWRDWLPPALPEPVADPSPCAFFFTFPGLWVVFFLLPVLLGGKRCGLFLSFSPLLTGRHVTQHPNFSPCVFHSLK